MQHITLEHDRLRISVDGKTGALREVSHPQAGISLITQPDVAAEHPFLLVFADGSTSYAWQTCTIQHEVNRYSVVIRWVVDGNLDLTVRLCLDVTLGQLSCSIVLLNPDCLPIAAVAYPYLTGIGRLGTDPDLDELVHPYATGFLVRNPLDFLPAVTNEADSRSPVALGLYPEGFSGATMQFMAYSAVGRGGFYIAAEDDTGQEKWLNFYRHCDGDLRLAVWHSPDDYQDRRTIATRYDTVLATLPGGTWYDAAERYKTWAATQSWTAEGPLWSRDERCRWLLEEVGLCTFGIDSRHNRAPWLQAIDRIAGTPVLHLMGPNWAKTGADYMNHLPGDLDDWFPACFHPENTDLIHRNGDYLVPFEFNLLFGAGLAAARSTAGEEALQVIPRPTFSRDGYDFPFLCPATALARRLHVERDRTLVRDYGVHGVYYDISVNNVRHICTADNHEHSPGDTVALHGSFGHLLSTTASAMSGAAGGRSIPQGTELINERMIPHVAFFQARAEASPAAPFEAGPFRDLIKAGVAEKIPLFAFVYHEYGPVRLDGWAKLSRQQGDFVFFILGRVFVQGGLIELNYEFSPLEDLDDRYDCPTEHYYLFDERRFAIDSEIAQFIGKLSRLRVGPANRYLAYGTMCRPAPLRVIGKPQIELDYFLFNCGRSDLEYEERGTMRVPSILQGAWKYRDESFAWILLNISPEPQTIELALSPPRSPSNCEAKYHLTQHTEGATAESLGPLDGTRSLLLRLPARCPVVLEAALPNQENLSPWTYSCT